MYTYQISEEEKAYLETYEISSFDRPSVAADMAVFSIMGTGDADEKNASRRRENYRKDPQKQLKLLLIRRASFPYKNYWALPGGFCRRGESTIDTARRELFEETGVKDAYLNPFAIFSEPDRDPRGWIISHAFLALIDGEKYTVRGGSDAWEAKWFGIHLEKKLISRKVEGVHAEVENVYELHLVCEEKENLKLGAVIKEWKHFENHHETIRYEIEQTEGLAFDHAKIILRAYLKLQEEAGDAGKIVFDLMPETFTLTDLQRAYETVQGKSLLVANFRRKIADYVTETDEVVEGAGHRPAKLFRRNLEAFYKE